MVEWLLRSRRRIIATGILIAITPLALLALYVNQTLFDRLVGNSNEKRLLIVQTATQLLHEKLDREVAFAKAYASRPYLLEGLRRGDRAEMARHLQNLIETSESIERAFIASPEGVLLQDWPHDPEVIGKNFSQRDWYRGVSRAWQPYVSDHYTRQARPQRYLFAVAVPIRDREKVIGILVMQPAADFLAKTMHEFKLSGGVLFVVDRQGRLLYRSGPGLGYEVGDTYSNVVVAKVLQGQEGVEQHREAASEEWNNAAYAPVRGYGWGVVSERPLAEVLAPVRRLLAGFAAATAIIALLAAAVVYRWAELFNRSQNLAQRLQREEAVEKAHGAILTLLNQEIADLPELGRLVLARIVTAVHADAGVFHEWREDRPIPCSAFMAELPAKPGELASECLRQRQMLRLSPPPPEKTQALTCGFGEFLPREIVAVPLFFQDQPAGVLELASAHLLDPDDLHLLERVAHQLGIAVNTISNAKARKELSEHLLGANDELQAMNIEVQVMNQELQAQEEELREGNQRLQEISRAKSDFLANMSHELRTPLNSVLGFSEVLEQQLAGPLNDKQREYVGNIFASGQHLLGLINDILDLAKVESGKLELEPAVFPLKELLASSLTIVREKAMKHNLRLQFDIAPEADREVMADQRKLKQIIYNLLANAVKFTPDGGAVTLAARLIPETGPEEKRLEISVRDTGIGIQEEDIAKLFQPFSQLESPYDKKHQGTGLGLALVKRLAQLHGGEVRVESTPGQGSCFIVTLPLNPLERRQGPPRATGAGNGIGAPAGGADILLIEDDPLARETIKHALEAYGHDVRLAENGEAGLTAALAKRPDLIILDIILPDLSGFEVAERLAGEEATSRMPIIALTAMDLSPAERARLGGQVFRIVEKGSLSADTIADLVVEAIASAG